MGSPSAGRPTTWSTGARSSGRTPTSRGTTACYFFEGKHIRDHVHRIKNPTLFIAGKNSVKGIDPQYELYKRMPNAQMHILDKASHFCWWDQVQDFNDLVLWFVTKED